MHYLSAAPRVLVFQQWDVVSIQEETEEGRSIHSDIKVPSQPSLPLQSLLNSVAQVISAVAPHTLPRFVLGLGGYTIIIRLKIVKLLCNIFCGGKLIVGHFCVLVRQGNMCTHMHLQLSYIHTSI